MAAGTAEVDEVSATPRQHRGKNRAPAYRRDPDTPCSTIALVPVLDRSLEHEFEVLFECCYALESALIREAQRLCLTFWADVEGRKRTPWKKLAEDIGLSLKGLSKIIWAHLDAASWMKAHVSKVMAANLASRVWNSVKRHLFGDKNKKHAGPLKVKTFRAYRSVLGGARSLHPDHPEIWATFKLCGTLQGHLEAYCHPGLPEGITVPRVLALEPETSVLAQPRLLPPPDIRRYWRSYQGPLGIHFTGGPERQKPPMVIPIRLPGGAGRWSCLEHFLGDPETWHKLTLVRFQDPSRPRGWRYEFHLLVDRPGYVSPASRAARE